jgi:hypothetical protein
MPDKPSGDEESTKAQKFLNVKIQGGITVSHETQSATHQTGCAQIANQGTTNAVKRRGLFWWIWDKASRPIRWCAEKTANIRIFG